MLGLVWTREDIAELTRRTEEKAAAEERGEAPSDYIPDVIRYPLSMLVRPELLDTLTGGNELSSQENLSGMMHVPKGTLSLANVSKEEFLSRVGATSATTDIDLDRIDRGPQPRGSEDHVGFRNVPEGSRR